MAIRGMVVVVDGAARTIRWWLLALSLTACGTPDPTLDADIRHGCLALHDPVAMSGEPIEGDTYTTFASPFLETYCTRCHSTSLTGDARNGAPDGFDWDDEASVREHLGEIRRAVGVQNYMPPEDPTPSCEERHRIVRWIDADAP
ncbi:MAG: hypothetical protein R3B82_23730 [Sandaracinaceae bacterium]